jgi:TRAP-type C4-dicarboxylate transport system permease small subunit
VTPLSRIFKQLIEALVAGVQFLTAVFLLVAVALNCTNIAGRYVFAAPISSAEEIMLFLLVGTVFLGNSIVAWEGKQIRMDVFLHPLPEALRHWLDVAADIAMITVSVVLIMLGWPVIEMLAEFDQRSQAADIPLAIPQALVPIGLGLTAILVAARLILGLGTRRHPSDEQNPSAAS